MPSNSNAKKPSGKRATSCPGMYQAGSLSVNVRRPQFWNSNEVSSVAKCR